MSLSVVIICRNSEATIGRTLASVAGLATEIVALDSGSTDRTIPMLEREGARVQRVEWKGHIATKQAALQAAVSDWILSLDADESLEPDLAAALREFVARNDPAVAGARVNRKVWYAGRMLEHCWQPERRLRVVRRADVERGLAAWGGVNPHDKLEITYRPDRRPDDPTRAAGPPRVIDLPGTLRHDSFADMREHIANNLRHAEVSARSLHDMGVRPSYLRLLTSPPGAFLKQMVLKSAWRDGWRGWVAAASTAVNTAMKHMLLIERAGLASQRERDDS